MVRFYDADDIIQLPKLTVAGALALGQSLLTAAQAAEALPASVDKAFSQLKKTHGALRKVAQERLPPTALDDSPDVRAADREIDAAWSAAFDWVTGWSKLPGKANTAKVALAQLLLKALFDDGLKFTQIKYKLEWAESQTRLDRIADQQLDQKFEELGGSAFLKTVKTTHKTYGDLLGMTKAKAQEAEGLQVRQPLDEFQGALRKYVVRVTASADEDDKASVALAKKLLAPLSEWESASPQEKNVGEAPKPGSEDQEPDDGG